jgi:hypothetical protein
VEAGSATATTSTNGTTEGTPPSGSAASDPTGQTGSGATDSEGTTPNEGERDESGRTLSREAASYRRRLREAEQERDSLRDQLDRLQTAEVERIAGGAGLAEPRDVWAFGAELAGMRTEAGSIDQALVTGLVADILKSRPGLRSQPSGDLGVGRGGAAAGTRHQEKIGLSRLLKPGG